MGFKPRDFLPIYNSIKVGLVVLQHKGSAPATTVGVDGGIALDSFDGKRYTRTAGVWSIASV